jgi:hypothetical protein
MSPVLANASNATTSAARWRSAGSTTTSVRMATNPTIETWPTELSTRGCSRIHVAAQRSASLVGVLGGRHAWPSVVDPGTTSAPITGHAPHRARRRGSDAGRASPPRP